MAHDQDFSSKQLSRRRFLYLGAGAGGAMLTAELVGSPAAAATAKVAKQTVNYQMTPKGPARCGSCAFFQAPADCNYVAGPISPSGWCMLFRAKT